MINTETSRLIYKGADNYLFLKFLAFRVAIILICLYAGQFFNDNPVGISIVFGIALLFILSIGDDEIHIYSDKVVILFNSLFALIFNKRARTYKLENIQKVYIREIDEPTFSENVFISIFNYVYPKARSKDKPGITIEFKNGETKDICTGLDEDEKKIIVYKINKLIE